MSDAEDVFVQLLALGDDTVVLQWNAWRVGGGRRVWQECRRRRCTASGSSREDCGL